MPTITRSLDNVSMTNCTIDSINIDGTCIKSNDSSNDITILNDTGDTNVNATLVIQSEDSRDTDTAGTVLASTGLSIQRKIPGGTYADWRFYIEKGITSNFGFGSNTVYPFVIKNKDLSSFNFISDGEITNVAMFTGSHISKIDTSDNILNTYSNDLIGRVVSSTGEYSSIDINNNTINSNKYEAITINDSHPIVKLTTQIDDKSVYGIISNFEIEDSTSRIISSGIGNFSKAISKDSDDRRVIINSLGEGGIWVLNSNGNVSNGDYISSYYNGYSQKQDSTVNNNYTVAKITCSCNFDENSDWNDTDGTEVTKYKGKTVTINGTDYKAAFLGCVYLCG